MIELDESERGLFEVLLASVKHQHKETVLRVAGGWVRDKILKQQSVDIDIALNDQSGVEFAAALNEFLLSIGKETRTIAIIQANPDQSKHLETANVRVMGYEIDCVNLRAETYTDSRIPEIRNGTAVEDALRRDFTINALFYNLNTKDVEDLTCRGLDDLKHGIIRTPISAHVTFRDDPLRVLRAIRFASRFQFALDQELVEAASSADIRSALRDKVSRERVYKECEGCMSKENSRPYLAFHLMHRLNLFDVVLPVTSVLAAFPLTHECAANVPELHALIAHWVEFSLHSMYWLNVLISGRAQGSLWTKHNDTDAITFALTKVALAEPKYGASVKVLFWAAATCALRKLHVTEKNKAVPLVPVLLREGLKMDNATVKSVQLVLDCMDQFDDLSLTASVPVETAGQLLRTCKEHWRDCILMACVRELSRVSQYPASHPNAPMTEQSSGVKRHHAEVCADQAVPDARDLSLFSDVILSHTELQVVSRFVALETAIERMGLDNVWHLKPLMNGSELIAQLGLPKGPLVGKLVEQQTIWQLRNLHSSDKTACIDYLRSILPSIL